MADSTRCRWLLGNNYWWFRYFNCSRLFKIQRGSYVTHHFSRPLSVAADLCVMNKNHKTVFRIATINSVIMLWGMTLGFKLQYEPNFDSGIMALFMFLSFITVGFQFLKIRPYLDEKDNIRSNWTLIAILPIIGVVLFSCLTVGGHLLVKLMIKCWK